jgi:hypothetical protein
LIRRHTDESNRRTGPFNPGHAIRQVQELIDLTRRLERALRKELEMAEWTNNKNAIGRIEEALR